MQKSHEDKAEESLNEIVGIIETHLASIPAKEAEARLDSIDKAHATARSRASEAQIQQQRSKKHSSRSYAAESPALCRSRR